MQIANRSIQGYGEIPICETANCMTSDRSKCIFERTKRNDFRAKSNRGFLISRRDPLPHRPIVNSGTITRDDSLAREHENRGFVNFQLCNRIWSELIHEILVMSELSSGGLSLEFSSFFSPRLLFLPCRALFESRKSIIDG